MGDLNPSDILKQISPIFFPPTIIEDIPRYGHVVFAADRGRFCLISIKTYFLTSSLASFVHRRKDPRPMNFADAAREWSTLSH